MAIYKGRSVQIINTILPTSPPSVTIANKDGSTSVVPSTELQFTTNELAKISKTGVITDPTSPNYNPHYKGISDTEYQDLVDGQDPVKMEEKLKKNPTPASTITVPAQTIAVHPVAPVVPVVTQTPLIGPPPKVVL
jgi:hypothetical protein